MTEQPASNARPAPRSADEIEAQIAATRERLASTIDSLAVKVQPENLAKGAIDKVKGIFVKDDGGVRIERVAAVAVAVVGLVVVRHRLRSWSRSRAVPAGPQIVYVPVPKSQLVG